MDEAKVVVKKRDRQPKRGEARAVYTPAMDVGEGRKCSAHPTWRDAAWRGAGGDTVHISRGELGVATRRYVSASAPVPLHLTQPPQRQLHPAEEVRT